MSASTEKESGRRREVRGKPHLTPFDHAWVPVLKSKRLSTGTTRREHHAIRVVLRSLMKTAIDGDVRSRLDHSQR